LRQDFFNELGTPHEQGRSPMKNQTDSSTTLARAKSSDAPFAPRLRASGLSCRRGHEWLFRDLSFSIWPGQMVWLRGPNGSGKTTLLRAVVGLTQADEGALDWSSGDAPTGDAARPRVVYIGHLNAMKDDLTVCESLQFLAGLHGCDASRKAGLHALRSLGLHHRRNAPVRTLSQGQRRRSALARLALEHQPSLWVLDEPFDALDAAGIGVVNSLLAAHLERGGSVLLTSHLALDRAGPKATELGLDHGMAQ
jgi:heme exporter protein A